MAEKCGKQDKHKQKEPGRENLARTKSLLSLCACACLSFALSANRSPILGVNKQDIEVNRIDSLPINSISHFINKVFLVFTPRKSLSLSVYQRLSFSGFH